MATIVLKLTKEQIQKFVVTVVRRKFAALAAAPPPQHFQNGNRAGESDAT